MRVDFSDKTVGGFNYELVRGLSVQQAGAAELGECMETMERITANDFGSWVAEWEKTAARVLDHARQLAKDDRPGAREAFMRASNYFRMACFYAAHTDPRHKDLWSRSRDCFHCMAALAEYPIEKVGVKFEGAVLPGYFMPAGRENRPTLIAIGGFDSTKEELYCWIGSAAREYGWNCLVFEGPGQWGALMDNPGLVFRPDYEKPVGAAVDYLMTRGDIDKEKIAVIGYSMGGYLCVRGALDPRTGKPMLFLFSEDDIIDAAAPDKIIAAGLLDYIQSLDCPRYVRLFTKEEGASGHCQMGGLTYARTAVFGWLEHALCGGKIENRGAGCSDLFVELFGKYGGAEGAVKAQALVNEVTFI
ncbi:MAG: alpha/beta hydrolase [Gracilibacteraceae bacterium]|jgi:pimeloyl-ACP methyl ester carboxylesterase|nr:alpha/beta hydrolase [Gracilibacteraceae bacterium]